MEQNETQRNGATPSEHKKKEKGILRSVIEAILLIAVVLLIRHFIVSPTVVQGNSMQPTLHPWDFLFANRWAAHQGDFDRGDIVILDPPTDERVYIKRIIAKGGDTISFDNGKVLVNGELLDEPYIDADFTDPLFTPNPLEVPEGQVFVMGDNRHPGGSTDSRTIGLIPEENIMGTIFFRYFPFNRFGPM